MNDFMGQHHSVLISGAAVLVDACNLIPNGAVAIANGLIQACGGRAQLRRKFPDFSEIRVAHSVLTPGFINAHSHLELTFLAGKIPGPTDFPTWVVQLLNSYPEAAESPHIFAASARLGAQESLRFGVTTVGDITRQHAVVRPVLQGQSPLRLVSFGEITALGRTRQYLARRLAEALDFQPTRPDFTIGLSPHAPYSVEGPALKKIAAAARKRRLPLCMHLAELREEKEFLADFSGPLGVNWPLMQHLQILDAKVPRFAKGPILWAAHYGLFGREAPVMLAHVNYADDAELDILARSGAAVAYCPRTRHYFGHDDVTPHRWREMLARGMTVCLATDSKASNPDLSVLREAQFLKLREPQSDPQQLLAMITTQPAAALGLSHHLGRLAPGFAADILAMPVPAPCAGSAASVAEYLIEHAPLPQQIWMAGQALSAL
ncbi:MAG: amidohydrolase family protein [Planctomycetia bacterium]|nr:amidohydrolase family protein [Planctomycetia bacterium]